MTVGRRQWTESYGCHCSPVRGTGASAASSGKEDTDSIYFRVCSALTWGPEHSSVMPLIPNNEESSSRRLPLPG